MNSSIAETFKIIFAGNHQSGKTLLLNRICSLSESNTINFDSTLPTTFPPLDSPQPTIATDLTCKTFTINGKCYKVQFWDTAGQEAYHSITASYFRSSQGVFLVFDLTDKESFESLDYWLKMIAEHSNVIPYVVLIANKYDKPNEEHKTTVEAIAKYCEESEYDLHYFMTSALTGENVENALRFMIESLVSRKRTTPQEEQVDEPVPNEDNHKLCC
ncbi:GTP-binding protein [Tritrichomonas musculus]|uniref:GTP-binding protein n=1 Tax=Tritrichomonas musculus TaxID=1915356 RepID=A0ABR2JDT5_9EUKA